MLDSVALRTILRKNGLDCPDDALTQLMKFHQLIIDWNSKINLISRKDSENILERHIIISLSLLFQFEFEEASSILDLGTGGGFPGIPLAIFCRSQKFTLLDSIQKKIGAVKRMTEDLSLDNAFPLAGRAEELAGRPNLRSSFHYIVSRAVSSITDVVRWGKPFLVPPVSGDTETTPSRTGRQMIGRGSIILYKGGDLTSEVEEAERKIKPSQLTVHHLTIEGIDAGHVHDKKLVIIQP